MLTKIAPSDKKFFNTQGKPKAKSYSLVYTLGNTETPIEGMQEKDFALCKWKKNQIRHYIQYRTGNINIVPNYE